jgi:probable F420-dependent oxidoreductase
VKVGLFYGNIAYGSKPMMEALAEAVDQNGIESVWAEEHPAVPKKMTAPDEFDPDMEGEESGEAPLHEIPFPDPMVWLSQLAALTETVKLGTGVLVLPLHNPVLLARAAATLDDLSDRRLILGVGLGWMKEEYEACGVSFSARAARLEEYIHALRAAWSPEGSYTGDTVSFENIGGGPKPPNGRIPIHIGASVPKGARRAGRLADGFFPLPYECSTVAMATMRATITGDEPDWTGYTLPTGIAELVEECHAAAVDVGRNPDDIELTITGPPSLEAAKQAADLGVNRYLVTPPAFELSAVPDAFKRLADDFVGPLS